MNLKSAVLYGAGNSVVSALADVRAKGYCPVCFADIDIKKQGLNYHGLPVMNLFDIENYKETHIYISVSVPLKYEIQDYLTNECGIRSEQIINYEAVSYYKSCYYIESAMIISRGEIYTCCYQGDFRPQVLPKVAMRGDIDTSVDDYVDFRDKLIKTHKDGSDSPCNKCAELKYGYWNDEKKVISLAYFAFYPCNLRCSYCDIHKTIGHDLEREIAFVKDFRYDLYIECLEHKQLISKNAHIEFSAGEIALNPNKVRIFDKIMRYPAILFSNCTTFDEQICEIVSKPDSTLITSLDCGTRETYLEIKGADKFDDVVENIRRYKERGNVQLKYIIILENTDQSDIDGFIRVCAYCGISTVRISCNINYDHNNLPRLIVDFAVNLGQRLTENNIEPIILPHFGDANTRYIEESVKRNSAYGR
jgi:sulfatase maturation enzyme AslB (radical SAM superfamily)